MFDVATPKSSDSVTGENCTGSLRVCNDNYDVSCDTEEILNCTNISNDQEVTQVLNEIRIKNVNRVIIGHLNVNFFAAKIDVIITIMPGNVDIMVFSETKLDDSYPMAQLFIEGFGKPLRFDRNANGGGLLIYVRADIPCKQLSKHEKKEKYNFYCITKMAEFWNIKKTCKNTFSLHPEKCSACEGLMCIFYFIVCLLDLMYS